MQSWIGVLTVAALLAGANMGCASSKRAPSKDAGGDVAPAPGGVGGTGGLPSAGGVVGTGGLPGAGGVVGTGGLPGAGGATALAGTTGAGGAGGTQTGGAPGTGGRGGATGSGGATATGVSGTGGSGRDGGTVDANLDANADSSTDAVSPNQFCEMAQTRSTAQDTLDVQQYALFKASTVLEGKLGNFVDSGDTSYAIIGVNRVWAGISQYGGLASASAIRMDRALYDQLGNGALVIAGFVQTHPLVDKSLSLPVWDQPRALLPKASPLAAELLGFHAWNTPNVAVVRVDEVLDGGLRLASVESLRGALPASFVVSLSELWPPLGLSAGSTWIGGFSEILTTPSGGTPSATLLELRPNTTDERATVTRALQTVESTGFATRYQAGLDQAKADASRLRLGWLYNQADRVAALEVTGIGNECCTGAGGIFHASSVIEMLHGQAPMGQVLTGGHAYYGKKACGDRFLYAFGPSIGLADGLGLDCQGKTSVATQLGSKVLHELAATADNLALARQWVASAPPLLRLYPVGSIFPPTAFDSPTGLALWSTPVSALTAVMAGTPAVFTITNVSELVPPSQSLGERASYVVRMRTPFYVSELSHLELREFDVAFTCADPRLLVAGTRWIGAVIGTGVISASTVAAPLAQGQLFLAPGLMLPERSDLIRTLGSLPAVAIN